VFVAAEVRYDVVLAPLLLGVALFGLVLVCTGDGRTRIAFAWAIGASVLLAFGATLMSLCTNEANPSLYVERCANRSYDWPLFGIPILLALALFGRSMRGMTIWLAGAVVFLAALAVPFFWLTTAR